MMKKYKVSYTKRADKALQKLDRPMRSLIMGWIGKNLVNTENPRVTGKALTGDFKGLWRYRVGDYRIIADIQDGEVLILVVDVGHRGTVYR